jgi:16S rRNA (cytosine1402-N4)-methyltransferase
MTERAPAHIPVLLAETIEALAVSRGGRYIDCTTGAGGHAEAVLEASAPDGRLLGLDADPEAIRLAGERLQRFGARARLVQSNFRHVGDIARREGFEGVQGVLFDLGVSSMQLEGDRGFSFRRDDRLDMRMDPEQAVTAAGIVNATSEDELANLIWRYGEERRSRRIARAIVNRRPLKTAAELASVVEQAVGSGRNKIHPATRTFQALRIAVNQELDTLDEALRSAHGLLGPGGRLVAISFHSLEDRTVKSFFRRESMACVCPPGLPECRCGHQRTLRIVTRKVVKPSHAEVAANPRARSARLRAAERVA